MRKDKQATVTELQFRKFAQATNRNTTTKGKEMSKQSLSEKLLEIRARAAQGFLDQHGSLDGFTEHWRRNEDGFLIAAKGELESENAKTGDTERKAALMAQHRSTMTAAEKAAFVGEHGIDVFQQLPE